MESLMGDLRTKRYERMQGATTPSHPKEQWNKERGRGLFLFCSFQTGLYWNGNFPTMHSSWRANERTDGWTAL